MSELEVRDWIDIIDSEIKILKKEQYLMMSMMGSSIIILAVLIWFTYTNFIQNPNLDYILGLFFIQNLSFYIILFRRTFYSIIYIHAINRIEKKLPVTEEGVELIINIQNLYIMGILIFLFMVLFIFEFFVIKNFLYYFMTSSLLIFIIVIYYWIQIIFKNLMNPIIEIYQKLKYDILLGKITNINVIRDKYLSIDDKPPVVLTMNEKGECEEF